MTADSRSVAIVEDDDLVRTATASLVRSLGLTAAQFASASAFLDAEPAAFGCIISDLNMPGMSGLDLLAALRARANTVPFILMTAYPTEQIRARAMDSGAYCFLEKPHEADTLVDCLAAIFVTLD